MYEAQQNTDDESRPIEDVEMNISEKSQPSLEISHGLPSENESQEEPDEFTSLMEKSENQFLQRCQSRVAEECWHITAKEKAAKTFILEYDVIKVGINITDYQMPDII